MEIKIKENLYDLLLNLYSFKNLLNTDDEKIIYEYSKYLKREINKITNLDKEKSYEILLELDSEFSFFNLDNSGNLKFALDRIIFFLSKELNIQLSVEK